MLKFCPYYVHIPCQPSGEARAGEAKAEWIRAIKYPNTKGATGTGKGMDERGSCLEVFGVHGPDRMDEARRILPPGLEIIDMDRPPGWSNLA